MTDPHRGNKAWAHQTALGGVALGILVGAVVLVFSPSALDQFVLPKLLTLLVGVPAIVTALLLRRGLGGEGVAAQDIDTTLVTLVVLFCACSVVAPAWQAQNSRLHVMGAVQVLLMTALFGAALVVRGGGGVRAAKWFVHILAIPPVVVSVFALGQSFGIDPMRLLFDLGSSRPGRWRTLTTLGNPTWTAELIAVSLPIVIVVLGLRRERAASRFLRLAVALLLVAGVAVTGSRGGIIGVGVGAFSLCLLERSPTTRGRSLFGAALVALLIVTFGVFCSRAAGASRWAEVEPITGRLALWAAGAEVLKESPVTGQGLGHTALVLPGGLARVAAEIDPDHRRWLPTLLVDRLDNDWLQVAVERGSPAGVLLFGVWLRALWVAGRRSVRRGSRVDSGIAASLLVFGVALSVSAPLHTPATAVYFWVFVGLAASGKADPGGGVPCSPGRRWPWFAGAGLCCAACVVTGVAALGIHAANMQAGEGHRWLRSGRPELAAQHLGASLQRVPWMTAASISLARALVASGQAEEALVVIDDGRLWAESEWFWAVEVRALNQLGLPEQAQRVLDEGLAILPRSPVLFEIRAKIP